MNHFNHKHGESRTRLHNIWIGLKQRRYTYEVPICVEWNSYVNFANWSRENGYDSDLTIDRVDPNKGYNPNNCQWISQAENCGKDKRILTDSQKIQLTETRAELGLTQRQFASVFKISRNTIQRAEKYTKNFYTNINL